MARSQSLPHLRRRVARVHCSVLQRIAVCRSALQCAAVHCSVPQCIAVCCGVCEVVYIYSIVCKLEGRLLGFLSRFCVRGGGVLECIAVCCSACSVLQYIAACRSAL